MLLLINKQGILKYIPVFIIVVVLCSGFSFIIPETSLDVLLKKNGKEGYVSENEGNYLITELIFDTNAIENNFNNLVQDRIIYGTVDQNPSFRGDMNKWLREKLNYPPKAVRKKIQGTVYVQFIVEKDGTLSDIKIARGVEPSLNKEALRVVSAMPAWRPGKKEGELVRVQFTLPIVFKLYTPKKS